jgi:cellulose synthase (UDP-forming)
MQPDKNIFKHTQVPRPILLLGLVFAMSYLYVIGFWFAPSNIYLFRALMVGQFFLIWQVSTYIFTVWNTERTFKRDDSYTPVVDVFITVAGEPIDIIEETVLAIKAMEYPNFAVYILNDGYVAKKDNWKEVELLASKHDIGCITRTIPGGAKAGNINNALRLTTNPYVCIFDADHVPHKDFLKETIPYFTDKDLGFVQTPQYYKNKNLNEITKGAWEQQELFFGPICKGKNNYNSATMCGTNMVISREAFMEVGGMCEESIAEDFVTGLLMHSNGWKSIYVPKVLAEGLAPEDFLSYYKQQLRWARGALDVIFRYNVFFRSGLTLSQRIQYLSSASHFLSGIVVIMNAFFPIIFLLTGQEPFVVTSMSLAAVFLPYMFVTLAILRGTSGNTFTFRSLAFSMGGFGIHLSALFSAITRQKSVFVITSKRAISGNFWYLVIAHLAYISLAICAATYGIVRHGLTPATANNIAWAAISCSIFIPFIYAALPHPASALSDSENTSQEKDTSLLRHLSIRRIMASSEQKN